MISSMHNNKQQQQWTKKNPAGSETKIADLYEARDGSKCRIIIVEDAEGLQRDQLTWFNKDVDVKGQMRTLTIHHSMMDSDTAHIDNEVKISAQEDGLTTQVDD